VGWKRGSNWWFVFWWAAPRSVRASGAPHHVLLKFRYRLGCESLCAEVAIGPALVTALLLGWGRAGWAAVALILVTGSLGSRRLGAAAGQAVGQAPADRC
jgi:hypothetical protein